MGGGALFVFPCSDAYFLNHEKCVLAKQKQNQLDVAKSTGKSVPYLENTILGLSKYTV